MNQKDGVPSQMMWWKTICLQPTRVAKSTAHVATRVMSSRQGEMRSAVVSFPMAILSSTHWSPLGWQIKHGKECLRPLISRVRIPPRTIQTLQLVPPVGMEAPRPLFQTNIED